MYTQLGFGISTSPGVSQRIIDRLIKGVTKTAAYVILISGVTMNEYDTNLRVVLKKITVCRTLPEKR